MSCKCAIITDEYCGYECDITGGPCMYAIPDSERCAREWGEGPDAEDYDVEDYDVEDYDVEDYDVEDYDVEGKMAVIVHFLNYQRNRAFDVMLQASCNQEVHYDKTLYCQSACTMPEIKTKDTLEFLNDVYQQLNLEKYIDKQTGHSLSCGDCIEYGDKLYMIMGQGFKEVEYQ